MKQPAFRFVTEYANYKKRLNADLAKGFPDMAEQFNGNTIYIDKIVDDWDRGLIHTDEAMKLIAEA